MSKMPYFPLYTNDWLSSEKILFMTPEQEGAYIRLLCYCWNNESNSLPNAKQMLEQMARLSFDKLTPVLKCFTEKEGRLYNERLDSLKEKYSLLSKKRQEAGKKGGQANAKQLHKQIDIENDIEIEDENKDAIKKGIVKGKRTPFEKSSVFEFEEFSLALQKKSWSVEKIQYYYESAKYYSEEKGGRYINWIRAVVEWDRREPGRWNKKNGQKWGSKSIPTKEIAEHTAKLMEGFE